MVKLCYNLECVSLYYGCTRVASQMDTIYRLRIGYKSQSVTYKSERIFETWYIVLPLNLNTFCENSIFVSPFTKFHLSIISQYSTISKKRLAKEYIIRKNVEWECTTGIVQHHVAIAVVTLYVNGHCQSCSFVVFNKLTCVRTIWCVWAASNY